MNPNSTIDYLFEDPAIAGQNYALISIVGPNMKQKCDVWGLKIRGVVNTIDQAKNQTQKLMNIDNNYDIYTVEVGKFFPLAVEPMEIQSVEYQNSQLNDLIKGYLENREVANQQWHARKNEMVQQAIRDGQEQTSEDKEHPIAVLQSVHTLKTKVDQLKEELVQMENSLLIKMKSFNSYTLEERESSYEELSKALESVENGNEETEKIKKELNENFKFSVPPDYLNSLLEEIKDLEHKLDILSTDKESNTEEIAKIENELNYKKKEINDNSNTMSVNEFINSNYKNSPYNLM